MRPLALLLAALTLSAACAKHDRSPPMATAAAPSAAPAVDKAPRPAEPAPLTTQLTQGRKLIRTAQLTLVVDDLAGTREKLEAQLALAHGFIAEAQISHDSDGNSLATLVLRIPADGADTVIAQLAKLGDVVAEHLGSEDVTGAHADLSARLANAHKLETRLQEIAATRTSSVEDLLAVEAQLSEVRGQIEQMTAQLETMNDQVALATVTLMLEARRPALAALPVPPPPSYGTVAGSTLSSSWSALGSFFKGLGLIIVALLPWSPIFVLAAWLGLRLLRRNKRPQLAQG